MAAVILFARMRSLIFSPFLLKFLTAVIISSRGSCLASYLVLIIYMYTIIQVHKPTVAFVYLLYEERSLPVWFVD